MNNKKFKAFILFLNNKFEDKLKAVDDDTIRYFHYSPEFNMSIEPNEVVIHSGHRTRRTGSWCPGVIIASGTKEKLNEHIEFIKKAVSRHTDYPQIPNAVVLSQVTKDYIYSKIPGAVDIKFTEYYNPIPMVVYDDGTTQALDCERLEKLTNIHHIVACAETVHDYQTSTTKVKDEMFFAS